MSLTLGTLLILFLLLPGLVFRKAFFVLPFDKRFTETNTLSELGIILIFSLLLQFSGFWLIEYFCPAWFKECMDLYNFALAYVFQSRETELCQQLFNEVSFSSIIIYQLTLWAFATFLGLMFNSLIRYFKWDRKYRILRFGNSWYYYFSGEAIEFPDIGGNAKEIDCVFVDTLVKSQGKEILYIGVLSDYELSANGGLKSFSLKGAKRRYLDAASEHLTSQQREGRSEVEILDDYYSIPSNLLVIPYNENVVNINFRYYADDEKDGGNSDNISRLEKAIQVISLAIIFIAAFLFIVWLINKIRGTSGKTLPEDEEAEHTDQTEI